MVFMLRTLKSWSSCIDDSSFALFLPWLFEEQQAFEKGYKFHQELETCSAENLSHHQKIIKQALQNCADC